MTRATVTVTHSIQLDQWVRGLRALSEDAAREGERYWLAATEVFFANTQLVVHVVTGNLKASGKFDVDARGEQLVAAVSYGGEGVDYARAERDRGGAHDYMARGWQASERTYAEAMPQIWQAVRRRWS